MAKNIKNSNLKSLISLGLAFAILSTPNFAKDSKRIKIDRSSSAKRRTTNLLRLRKNTLNPKQLKSNYASWGVDPDNGFSSINLVKAWKRFTKRREVVVAIIDTGIDPTHPFLKSNIYVPKGSVSLNNYGIDFSKNRKSVRKPYDTHGHGTHVAGIVKSVYPGVKLLALKYYNRNASGQDNLNSTIDALEYAVNHGVDIINYSGGGPEPDARELSILKKAERKGILVIAAAGNEESNIDIKANAYYPASYGLKNIITVTTHDQSLKTLISSNYGTKTVDISAPGYRIKSALPNHRAGYLTGTSQSTAFVSGVAALIKAQYPNLGFQKIKSIIKRSAKREVSLASKCSSGGRLDANRALILSANESLRTPRKRNLASKFNLREQGAGKIYFRKAN